MSSGAISVAASSPLSRFTDPEVLVSGEYAHSSFAGPVWVRGGGSGGTAGAGGAGGSGGAGGWWRVDLGEGRRLRCNHYTMRQDGSTNFPRQWELQGHAGDGATEAGWITLKRHDGDATLCGPGQWGSWPVESAAAALPVRFLRLKLTGPTTAGRGGRAGPELEAGRGGGCGAAAAAAEALRLCVCSVEFYGLLTHAGGQKVAKW